MFCVLQKKDSTASMSGDPTRAPKHVYVQQPGHNKPKPTSKTQRKKPDVVSTRARASAHTCFATAQTRFSAICAGGGARSASCSHGAFSYMWNESCSALLCETLIGEMFPVCSVTKCARV